VAETPTFIQRDQPDGVPPLALTGERTLPDIPAENYWFQRHLVVYEWIAERLAGLDVVDVAAGEGYGAGVMSRTARSVQAIEPNPEACEHARLKYPAVEFRRDLAETFTADVDAIVFLQTIEHVHDPDAVLEHFKEQLRPGGVVYVSTPNVLTLAPKGARRSGNPWHIVEYRPEEFRELCERHFGRVELHGLHHARMLRVHDVALRLGWDRVHRTLRFSKPFYDRFTPAISVRDFELRRDELQRALDFVAVLKP
jgi:SAM-dependent methyltransferase